jgi:hypothetical protein
MSANPFDQDVPVHDSNGAGIDLAQFDEEYAAAEAPAFDEVPDGRYQATVDRVELTASSAGDPMLKWDLRVISGPHEGRHIFKNAVITPKSLPFVKGDLTRFGLEMDRLSQLPEHLPSLLDKTVEVSVRTKGDYKNVYFGKVITVPTGGTDTEVPW